MHTVCVYSGPAMLLRLIEYQDWWKKIGMADMLYSILPRLCGLIRQNMRVYAHKIHCLKKEISFVKKERYNHQLKGDKTT